MILALQTDGMTARLWLLGTGVTGATGTPALGHPTVEWDSGRSLSDELLDYIVTTLHKVDCQLEDLTGLIVFSGPGSFTSLRIGHAVANALADSLHIPVVGARGDDWLAQALMALPQAKPGQSVLPYYGSEAHITRPKA